MNFPKKASVSFMLIGITVLTGCDAGISGQIEKCVQAVMVSNEPYKNKADKAETEALARTYCLKAAAGKD